MKTVKDEIDALKGAVAELADGQWNKRDISAVITILGSLAGLASAAFLSLQAAGIL
jgi:hypothetical protein